MKLVIQRVNHASVEIGGEVAGAIQRGLLILVGITHDDRMQEVEFLAGKCARLRIFEDDAGKMNRSVQDISGSVLVVSQFTLYGDSRKGNRPGFSDAAQPDHAVPLYEAFIETLHQQGLPVESGVFGADMKVSLENDGPVTLIMERNAL